MRDRIRTIARQEFIAHGYDATTVRQIARAAGCDAAMVNYYYGSKQRLFRQCFNLPADPAQEMLELLLPDPTTAGERIVRHVLALYEQHLTADTMGALMLALMTDATTTQRFRGYIRTEVLDKVAASLHGGPEVAEQIELATAQIYGVVVMRYFVRLEPLASMPRERLVAELGPFIQARINRIFRDPR